MRLSKISEDPCDEEEEQVADEISSHHSNIEESTNENLLTETNPPLKPYDLIMHSQELPIAAYESNIINSEKKSKSGRGIITNKIVARFDKKGEINNDFISKRSMYSTYG